ncbi:MAG: DUF3267 domain-containing protein [Clostridia bacterium]|nr:DUF3267 domain-containing protein [Clostridia bacterium]
MNYRELPGGYRYAGTMDFTRNKKQIVALLKVAVALTVIPFVVGVAVSFLRPQVMASVRDWRMWLWMALMLITYIPLHELTHGAVMFALSGVPPTYGFKLPYAWAGSTVWFDRRSHVITALAPVVVWGVVLQALLFALPEKWFWPLWIAQISNLSGSAGDIYCAWALLRMDGDLLIQDTGVRMRIMKRQPTEDSSR